MDWLSSAGKNWQILEEIKALEQIGSLGDTFDIVLDQLDTNLADTIAAVRHSQLINASEEVKKELAQAVNVLDLIAIIALEDELWLNLDTVLSEISGLGLELDSVKQVIIAARELLGQIPDKYYKLLRHVDAFAEQGEGENPGLVAWTLSKRASDAPALGKGMVLDLGASGAASLEFEAGHLFPYPQSDSRYLRSSVSGKVEANASAMMPVNLGAISAAAGGTGELQVNYLSQTSTRYGTFALEAAAAVKNMVNPMSLGALMDKILNGQLRAMTLTANGQAYMNTQVGLTRSINIAKLADLSGGLTIDAEIRVGGSYAILARPDQNGALYVEVSSNTSRTSEVGLALGVIINASQLAQHIKDEISPSLAGLKQHFTRIDTFLQPGKMLKSRLDAKINSLFEDASFAALAKLAVGQTSTPAARKNVVAALQGFLDSQTGAWEADAAVAADKGIAWLIGRYPALDHPVVKGKLRETLKQAANQVSDELEQAVKALAEPGINKLLAALEISGIPINTQLDAADAALAGVRKSINNYVKRVEDFLRKAEAMATSDVQIQFAARRTNSQGTSLQASAIISQDTPKTRRAYQSLISGKLDELLALVDSGVAGFELDLREWQRFAEYKAAKGVSLIFMDIELGVETVFSSKATVRVDQTGALSILANAEWTRRRKAYREERQFMFTSVYSLIAARLTRSFTASLSLKQTDEDTRGKDVRKFLQRIEQNKLIASGSIASALDLLRQQRGHAQDSDIASTVSVKLALNHEEMKRLLFLDSGGPALSKTLIARATLELLIESGHLDRQDFAWGLEAIRHNSPRGKNSMTPEQALLHYKRGNTRKMAERIVLGHESKTEGLKAWADAHDKAVALFTMLKAMQTIYRASPQPQNASEKKLEQWYRDQQKPMDKALSAWVVIESKFPGWLSDQVSDETLAFLLMINRLAAPDRAGVFPFKAYLTLDESTGAVLLPA